MNEWQLTDGEDPIVNHSAFDAYINNAAVSMFPTKFLCVFFLFVSVDLCLDELQN